MTWNREISNSSGVVTVTTAYNKMILKCVKLPESHCNEVIARRAVVATSIIYCNNMYIII